MTLWRFTRDSVYAVDSMRTDADGGFGLLGSGPGIYQLRFGTRGMPVGIGPLDSVTVDGVVQRMYRVPLLRIGAADAFVLEQVDVPASSTEYDPERFYPKELRSKCVDGDVLPSVVVDGDGKPDMSTFKIVGASRDGFNDAVREAMARARFEPAQIGGVRVRQVVSSPVHFRSNCRPRDN
ncbi:MAG TPA: TonB family protein [Gemmatimonadaceae bacterium]|nr:TonB family protein [Gemmatimonadaceae bacterium]